MIGNLSMLCNIMLEQEQVPEEVFDRLGFPKDINVHGMG
jgi:hypothetical protein